MVRAAQTVAGAGLHARVAWHTMKSKDFALALATPALGRSPHFAVHHVAAEPGFAARPAATARSKELSTDEAPSWAPNVDNTSGERHWWLGLVVPKRHARRAVTRSLLKREMRLLAARQRDRLPPGQWVIRLRAPFDPRRFPSAASEPLRCAARQELEAAFARVVTQ